MVLLTKRATLDAEVGLSTRRLDIKEVDIEDLNSYGSRGDHEIVEIGVEVSSVSHPGEGILLVSPRSRLKNDDLGS